MARPDAHDWLESAGPGIRNDGVKGLDKGWEAARSKPDGIIKGKARNRREVRGRSQRRFSDLLKKSGSMNALRRVCRDGS